MDIKQFNNVAEQELVLTLSSLDEITPEVIVKLIDGDPLLVVVPRVLPIEISKMMTSQLLSADWGGYSEEIGAGHIGVLRAFDTLFGCFGDPTCSDYFDRAGNRIAILNRLLWPIQNPAQALLERMDMVWPHGADLLDVNGRKCYVGLPRLFADGGAAEMHVDRADWDLPGDITSRIRSQLAFNFCVSQTLGPNSGSLQLWPDIPDKATVERLRRSDLPYAMDESRFGPPLVSYRPNPGDFYLFNAFRPHAVRAAGGGGVRVTISGFVDYFGNGEPLALHS